MRQTGGASALLLTFLLAATPTAARQVSGDRPGFWNGPSVLPAGAAQFEIGYLYSDLVGSEAHSLGEAVVRYGLEGSWELRLGFAGYQRIETAGAETSGPGDSSIGVKWSPVQRSSEGGVDLGLLVSTTLPTGERQIGVNAWQPSAAVSMGWSLSEKTGLTTYLGYASARAPEERFDQLFASVVLSYALREDVGVFVESYGFSRESPGGSSTAVIDAGVTKTLSERWVIDLWAGTGLGSSTTDFFVGAGFVTGW